jgi:hypothetical protein
MLRRRAFVCVWLAVGTLWIPGVAHAQQESGSLAGESIRISRLTGAVVIDGVLAEDVWQQATRVEQWYETNPGDNVKPLVRSVGYLGYDDRAFYAAFEFDDPDPSAIRAPLNDRDNVPGFTDYGGVILDTRGDGQRAVMMLANPRAIQYDAITDDASGEDSSPEFFWDAAAKITPRGWTLEIRVPFSSLRYRTADPQTWGILLYRNWPRAFRYQMFSARLPRGSNCFICHRNPLTGLERLPAGGHLVAAPYVSGSSVAVPRAGLGSDLVSRPIDGNVGIDVKWLPTADNAIDFTANPDFSQVESDTAQISTNERFALFFPEKRPFFLEGVDLFSTPLQAVYTRTITAPEIGGRATGKQNGIRYTVLVAKDEGGGSMILPGPNGSDLADQDFGSSFLIARAKRDLGLSFVSMLATLRENADGNGHNRVVGPDFQWRPSGSDVISGQLLYSDTRTPRRPDLTATWDGRALGGHALRAEWNHNTAHFDWSGDYRDIADDFRADTGFIPQVGMREMSAETGWTFRPNGFLRRVRTYLEVERQVDRNGALIVRQIEPTIGMDSKLGGFMQFRYLDERVRTGGIVLPRRLFGYVAEFSPSRRWSHVSVDGTAGRDVDFTESRPGTGATVNLSASLHPTDHLGIELIRNQRWLNIDRPDGRGGRQRLFTANVSRLKGTYTFTPRLFVRAIAQYVSTDRDPLLFSSVVADRSGTFGGSLLLAYKLNWQSVLFVGYGDNPELTDRRDLARLDREVFLKMSYAFQK